MARVEIDPAILAQLEAIEGVVGLSESSNEVAAGDVFVACARDDAQRQSHIDQAVSRGAVAVLLDAQATAPTQPQVPLLYVPKLAAQRGALAAAFYDDPSQQIQCVGITGTNGKTSIAHHVCSLSNALGTPSGYSGTLGWGSLQALMPSAVTTAAAVTLQRQFANFRQLGLQRAAVEISSHALDQQRAAALHLNVGVFSNLTRDHLDYHGSMEHYAAAKAKMFTTWPLQLAVINADDDMGRKLLTCARASEVLSYGSSGDIAWRATAVRKGMHVLFDTPWGRLESTLPVAAEFAVANIAAAIGVLLGSGHCVQDLAHALEQMQSVPGRMQVVAGAYGTPKVIVDYAHTPDALEKVLGQLAAHCRGKLICVVGCGGNRDRGKRPQMAQTAAQYADRLWFTSDNPRDESPDRILQDMLRGLTTAKQEKTQTLEDRGAAITAAVQSAGVDDVVVIAGKGHEQHQEIAGVQYPFSDVAYVENLFKENS